MDSQFNIQALTDQELQDLDRAITEEQTRRRSLANAVIVAPELAPTLLESMGKNDGAEFVQPLGAHDSYPEGWHVMHGGKEWVSTRVGAVGVPGESGDWKEVPVEGSYPDWRQPTGAHDAYKNGDMVLYNNHLWRNDQPNDNVWAPGTPGVGWVDLGVYPPQK